MAMMGRNRGDRGSELHLNRLRLVTIVVPVAFILLLEIVSIFVLRPLVTNGVARLLLIFGILVAVAVPFAVWVFRVIERQQESLADSAILLQNVPDHAIFMLDPAGKVLTWNPGAERMKGYEPQEIIGASFSRFYSPEDMAAGQPERHLDVAIDEGRVEYEGWRVRKDESRFWANVVLSAVRAPDGKLLGFSKVTRDITDRKLAEQEIQKLNVALGERVSELAAANKVIERRRNQLQAVNEAIGAISSHLETDTVLQRIVDSARDVVDAQYGALGVSDDSGRILQFITSGITMDQRKAIGPLPQGHGLLGALIREATPIRLADIQMDPRSSGFPPNHPPMKSLLGVPILYQGKAIGDLYMADKNGAGEFSDEDQELLVLLGGHAAVAISNARLYEEARSSRDELRVLNQGLEAEVAQRTRQIELQSREMTKRILQAQEEERKRIARELHDETAQALSTLLINIDLLELQLPPSEPRLQTGLERLRVLAKRTLDGTRALSHDLRPTILDDVGLVAAIHWLAEEWTQSFGVPVVLNVDDADSRRLPPETEVALFRIVQEALTNAGKYANATEVNVSLEFPDGTARLTVEDDGEGFDARRATTPSRHGGLGLYGMRERTELIGGTFRIESTPGEGTRITVAAPTGAQTRVR